MYLEPLSRGSSSHHDGNRNGICGCDKSKFTKKVNKTMTKSTNAVSGTGFLRASVPEVCRSLADQLGFRAPVTSDPSLNAEKPTVVGLTRWGF